MAEFKNPLEMRDAPDPFMTYDPETGYYYALFTCGNRLELYRSRHAASILTDKDTLVVFRVNEKDGIYGCVWLRRCTRLRMANGTYTQAALSLPATVRRDCL